MAQKNILKYILLGLLSHQQLAGYDIKKLFEGELGDFWYSNHSQIYPELKRMESDGFIKAATATVGTKLEKTYYTITPSGTALLENWMHDPLNALVPSRDEFTMKLYLINDAHDPLVRKLFHEEIERHQEKHQYLKLRWQQLFQSDEYRRQHYGHALILEQAIQREQQRLDWLRYEYENLPAQ